MTSRQQKLLKTALTEGTRQAILRELLQEEEIGITMLMVRLGYMPMSVLRQHLIVLERTEVVTVIRDSVVSVNRERLSALLKDLNINL